MKTSTSTTSASRRQSLLGLGLLASLCAGTTFAFQSDVTLDYTYDALGRLERVDYSDGTALVYEYDLAGNLLSRRVTSDVLVVDAVVDFDGEGELPGQVSQTTVGRSSSADVGPIGVDALLPSQPGVNSAVLFDSSQPTGEDFDLGTPNQTFGGPGIGAAGEAGQPFENAIPLGNLLIVAEDLVDENGDGLVDDPDDAIEADMRVTLDFGSIVMPFVPSEVTVYGLTLVNVDPLCSLGEARFYGSKGELLRSEALVGSGVNGVRYQALDSVGGVSWMELVLNHSCGIAEVHFSARQ